MINLIYVMSDLHGCYGKYLEMLEKISFSSNDTLYILGDVVDRGDGGIKILQDMMKRKNILPIMGNHERMALDILQKVYNELEYEGKTTATVSSSNDCKIWFAHGGYPTYHAFSLLHPRNQRDLIEYMESFCLEDDINVGRNQFYLAHSALKERPYREFDKTMSNDKHIWERMDYNKPYFQDKYFVSGHSPTFFIGAEWKGRIYKNCHHIAIDCGVVYGEKLGCICLDDLTEYYV